jgi:hypothetical protein
MKVEIEISALVTVMNFSATTFHSGLMFNQMLLNSGAKVVKICNCDINY